MGRIQSNVGLITGVPIQDTVANLMKLAARPRDLLKSRTDALRQQQVGLNSLTALVVALQLSAKKVGKPSIFTDRTITSSAPNLLSAAKSGTPLPGTYRFQPIRQAQTHQFLSSPFASIDAPLREGDLAIRFGGFIDTGVSLDQLNGGGGVQRGRIRIVDRSGASEIIDLQYARTIDDVIEAINNAATVNVKASIEGDAIRITDLTGQSSANLSVQDVGAGTTAADLGLASINVNAPTALGADVFRLSNTTKLSSLNDGNGIPLRNGVADLEIELHSGGTPLRVDFGDFSRAESQASGTTVPANGDGAALKFTAVNKGGAYDGVRVRFVDSGNVTQGNETVTYQADQKLLTFDIDAGGTTANDVVAALARHTSLSQLFSAEATGGGTGLVALTDTATLGGGAPIAATDDPTVGDLLRVLNDVAPQQLAARISADGDRIELIDKTTGSGTFTVRSAFGGGVAEALGLAQSTSGATLTGRRLRGGLKTTLLSTLRGGQGLGALGSIQITDRSGASAVVDLSGSETFDDVVTRIQAAGVGVTARVNRARNGLEIIDTTGATSGHLIIENLDATETADKLGVAINDAVGQVNGGSLDRQVVSRQTRLATYRGGEPVREGSFIVTDSNGAVGAINLSVLKPKTIGDVLDAINGLGLGVEARINDQGDGIALIDTAGGSGTLNVRDSGNGTAAKDLGIQGDGKIVEGSAATQILSGSTTLRIHIEASDTLKTLADKINAAQGPATVAIFNEGGPTPYRLSLVSRASGRAGELLVYTSGNGLNFLETTAARDALLVAGGSATQAGLLISSSSNTFNDIVEGLSVTVAGAATEPVEVRVTTADKSLLTNVKLFVDKYNETIAKLRELTKFDPETNTTGVLFGTTEALRVDNALGRLVSGTFLNSGAVRSLADVGIDVRDDGKLDYDESKLKAAYSEHPQDVERFFTEAKQGFAARLDDVAERLAGVGSSLLVARNDALQRRIDFNSQRIDEMNKRLDRQQEALLNQFYRLETTGARLQNTFNALSNLQIIPPLTSSKK